MQTHTDNFSRAKFLSCCLSNYNKRVGLKQFTLYKTLVHKLHRHDRDTPLLGHAALVGVLCLLDIVHNQVSGL